MGIIMGGIATGIMRPLLVFSLAPSVLPFCEFCVLSEGAQAGVYTAYH